MSTIVPEFDKTDRLRKARELTGLDRKEFARRIGVARQTVSTTELGKSNPSRLLISAWASATGVSPEWIETGAAPADLAGATDVVHPPGLEPGTHCLGVA